MYLLSQFGISAAIRAAGGDRTCPPPDALVLLAAAFRLWASRLDLSSKARAGHTKKSAAGCKAPYTNVSVAPWSAEEITVLDAGSGFAVTRRLAGGQCGWFFLRSVSVAEKPKTGLGFLITVRSGKAPVRG